MTSHYFGHFLFVRSGRLHPVLRPEEEDCAEDKQQGWGVTGGQLRGFLWTKGGGLGDKVAVSCTVSLSEN